MDYLSFFCKGAGVFHIQTAQKKEMAQTNPIDAFAILDLSQGWYI